MAFAYGPDRTIIVEMGRIRDVSDLAGLYFVKWRQDDHKTRKRLLHKRKPAKCPVNDTGTTGWEQGERIRSGAHRRRAST